MSGWVLFDDPASVALRPLTWTRPTSELLLGVETLEQRWRRLLPLETLVVAARGLLATATTGRVSLRAAVRAASGDGSLWISDRLLPSEQVLARVRALPPDARLEIHHHVVAFRIGGSLAHALGDWAAAPESAPDPDASDIEGRSGETLLHRVRETTRSHGELDSPNILSHLGDLIRAQETYLIADLTRLLHASPVASSFGECAVYRPDGIRFGRRVRLDHGAVLDARDGPIVLSDDVEVHPRTWIKGPCFAGRGTRLLGGKIGSGSSFGSECRLNGEIEATVFIGHGNKAHDGFIGHSYLGEWINLGALTTNSDLKNNYSPVTLEGAFGKVSTGQKKVGAFIGDHVKTRIGCLLNSGTVIGMGSSLHGTSGLEPKWVPDFVWGSGADAAEHAIEKFLQTAEIVMSRRGREAGIELRRVLRAAHAASGDVRRDWLTSRGASAPRDS